MERVVLYKKKGLIPNAVPGIERYGTDEGVKLSKKHTMESPTLGSMVSLLRTSTMMGE